MRRDAWYDRPLNSLQLHALHHWNIRLTCRCGRCQIFDGAALWWLFERRRWPDQMSEVPRRFWCKLCSAAGEKVRQARWERTRERPTENLPLPDEREWKRLVSRYRT